MSKKKDSLQKKLPNRASPDLFTRQLTSYLMVQAGILPRSVLGKNGNSVRKNYANT